MLINFFHVNCELITLLFSLFSPTNKQPNVSAGVLPGCIKIPSYPLTFNTRGTIPPYNLAHVVFLNVYDVYFNDNLYVPVGIAV